MIGALISGGAALASSLLGKSQADEANKTQLAIAERNIALQKKFARKGIQWRTEDAKKAGIHPLYALGASTHNFSPVSVGTHTSDWSGIAKAGQDIGRAVDAGRTQSMRNEAIISQLSVERAGLENDLLRSQIAKLNQAGSPPAMPDGTPRTVHASMGQGLPPGVGIMQDNYVDTPQVRTGMTPEGVEPAAIPGTTWEKGEYMGLPAYFPQFSKDLADRMDENYVGSLSWSWRNHGLPMLSLNQKTPPFPLPEGYDKWIYNPLVQGYVPYKHVWGPIYW